MRTFAAWLVACAILSTFPLRASAELKRAIYVYETHSITLCQWEELLEEVGRQGYRRIYLNLDEGNFFLLDAASSRKKIAEMARLAHKHRMELDVLTLQDSRWLKDWPEAVARVARLQAFLRENPRAVAGLHIDVEPHALRIWEQAPVSERFELLQKFAHLLRKIREQVRQAKPRLRFSATLPWWFAPRADRDEVLRSRMWRITQELDEVILMAYDEPGTNLFGENLEALEDSVRLERFMKQLPRGGRARLAVATYDFVSPESLAHAVATIERRYIKQGRFAGIAVFHHNGHYASQPLRQLSGLVLDASSNQPLAGAVVSLVEGDAQVISSRCGYFQLTNVEKPAVTLRIVKDGYQAMVVPVALLEPGRETVLAPTSLHRSR